MIKLSLHMLTVTVVVALKIADWITATWDGWYLYATKSCFTGAGNTLVPKTKITLGFTIARLSYSAWIFFSLGLKKRGSWPSTTTFVCPEMFTNELCRCGSAHDQLCLKGRPLRSIFGLFFNLACTILISIIIFRGIENKKAIFSKWMRKTIQPVKWIYLKLNNNHN